MPTKFHSCEGLTSHAKTFEKFLCDTTQTGELLNSLKKDKLFAKVFLSTLQDWELSFPRNYAHKKKFLEHLEFTNKSKLAQIKKIRML